MGPVLWFIIVLGLPVPPMICTDDGKCYDRWLTEMEEKCVREGGELPIFSEEISLPIEGMGLPARTIICFRRQGGEG